MHDCRRQKENQFQVRTVGLRIISKINNCDCDSPSAFVSKVEWSKDSVPGTSNLKISKESLKNASLSQLSKLNLSSIHKAES